MGCVVVNVWPPRGGEERPGRLGAGHSLRRRFETTSGSGSKIESLAGILSAKGVSLAGGQCNLRGHLETSLFRDES